MTTIPKTTSPPAPLPHRMAERVALSPGGEARGFINTETGRLTVAAVERLHALLGGDPVTEEMILTFIAHQYGAKNLFYLPANVTAQILKRPADFIRAAKLHCEPELPF